jgi:magnesium-transporting ATPase (P-type)
MATEKKLGIWMDHANAHFMEYADPIMTKIISSDSTQKEKELKDVDIAKLMNVNLQTGLKESSINERITKYGLNSYVAQKQKSIWLILFEQFQSPIILLLLVAPHFGY